MKFKQESEHKKRVTNVIPRTIHCNKQTKDCSALQTVRKTHPERQWEPLPVGVSAGVPGCQG